MRWPAVLLYAVGAAVITTVFLTMPIFKNTSFERMGAHLESWIFFAVIIMANCKKPLESALKVFVFFLVSRPLIYLFQVPFSRQGRGIFKYYPYWFGWTPATFPAAFIGRYIRRKDRISALIFAPVLAFLGYTVYEGASACVSSFPHLIVTALFCALQIVLYVFVFFPKRTQKLVGFAVPVVAAVVCAIIAAAAPIVSNRVLTR